MIDSTQTIPVQVPCHVGADMHTPALVEFQRRSDKYREQLNRSGVPLDLAGEVARILAAETLSSAPLRSPQQRRLIQQANLYLSPNARAGWKTSRATLLRRFLFRKRSTQ